MRSGFKYQPTLFRIFFLLACVLLVLVYNSTKAENIEDFYKNSKEHFEVLNNKKVKNKF